MVVTTSIDDLFRQKNLNEIHDVLKQTRSQVEAKKREIRELVGDHYRSVLESSDHIRAMSECAAKVSAGADRIEGLIASMRELAASPPTPTAGGARMFGASAKPEEDYDYRVGMRVMALLEVPETVRAKLGEHHFAQAARTALVDAAMLQEEVSRLLAGGPGPSGDNSGSFDLATLVQQQQAVLKGLPRQVAAACVDAFSAAGLVPASAAESFAVHLLLNPSRQPLPLLRLFLQQRSEALVGLLDSNAGGRCGVTQEGMNCGARLAAAAVLFEGTVVLSAQLASKPGTLEGALASVLEGGPDRTAAEERAAIEGRAPDALGIGAVQKRVEALVSQLSQTASGPLSLATELARLGRRFLEDWAPEAPSHLSLAARCARLVAQAPAGELSSCAALAGVLKLCTDKVLSHRAALTHGTTGSWASTWREATSHFSPGSPAVDDALVVLANTIESACSEVVRERVASLHLELVPAAEEGLDEAVDSGTASEAQQREELTEMQRQSQLHVARFDEQLGEVVSDLNHIGQGQGIPPAVNASLLDALHESLVKACGRVHLPPAGPLWPRTEGSAEGKGGEAAANAPSWWLLQRGAARAAGAFDALLAAATGERTGEEGSMLQLHKLLAAAQSSGEAGLASQAQAIEESVRQSCNAAYCTWARLAVVPEEGAATLEAFWRLSDEDIPQVCGWGSAKFESKDAVPVPVQASPFVLERLALGARRALDVGSRTAGMPQALVAALKVALSEAFVAAYEAHQTDQESLENRKRSGMHHLLQWLFDLNFLRIALSVGHQAGAGAQGRAGSKQSAVGGAAYEALLAILDRAEAVTLSEPVHRCLYQEVLKASVKSHVQGVKILLAPFFLHNPLYGFLFQSQPSDRPGALAASDGDGFELQATLVPPLRPSAPRFVLLPVANASALVGNSAELDARLGLSADAAARAAARGTGASPAGGGTVSSLMQQLGAWRGPLGNWGGGGTRPEVV